MVSFIIILLLILVAFGVIRQSITYPDRDADWDLIREVLQKPYFMLYGEVYAPEIDREFSKEIFVIMSSVEFNSISILSANFK